MKIESFVGILKKQLKRVVVLLRIKRNYGFWRMYRRATCGNKAWEQHRNAVYDSVCSNYAKYLCGKRVVIVGPAPSVDGSAQHDFIESFDVIVRVNEALPIPESVRCDVGSRTDILYHCMLEMRGRDFAALVDGWGLKFLCSAFPNTRWYVRDNLSFLHLGVRCPYRILPLLLWKRLFKALGCTTPNTGTTAICDLLSHDIKELYITGFTFYQGGYSQGYKEGDVDRDRDESRQVELLELEHDQAAQCSWLRQLWKTDSRIKVDDALEQIFNDVQE